MDSDQAALLSALRVVVMGVSGSGKSTVGELLARKLGLEYSDADDFHNPANVAKMSAGIPLTDEDRWPWLDGIGRWLEGHEGEGAVVTCSALKRAHRDALRGHAQDLWFLYCAGSVRLIAQRIAGRAHHFMPASLLQSQFDALEPPTADEHAIAEYVTQPPEAIVSDFLEQVAQQLRD